MTASDEDKKIAWNSYHEKLLNREFTWDRNSFSQADTVSDIPCMVMVMTKTWSERQSDWLMKTGKAAG